uniref:EOG090X00JH n=1 Tax=Lynceus sp. MCZ IZ 141354 TaxID=1930659 RepID=A0A9N6ZFE1_9CRUS|nr:EOG090X00JH [Lynceus sp. MCZ IZ 141354]
MSSWRNSNEVQSKTQFWSLLSLAEDGASHSLSHSKDKENRPSTSPVVSPRSTIRRQTKANKNVSIPRFYFPSGRPSNQQNDVLLQRIAAVFQQLPGGHATREQFGAVAKACGCPLYWKVPLFMAARGEETGVVSLQSFLEFWQKLTNTHHDEASRFVHILTTANPAAQRSYLIPEDFAPLIQDVVDTHPGLVFLKEASEFHSRYVHTIIARIYYCVNRSWSGRITASEVRNSILLPTIRLLEEEEDINQITDFFSYEHFYVIYCKFWELDKDHDLFIDKNDLARHNDRAISSRMIDRIFSGAVKRGQSKEESQKMSYAEFVWFLLAEEDKRHPTAIEYWFRCMDVDGDGYISMYELEYFYEEQLQRMEALGIETLPFEDCLCQMLDMVNPAIPGKISLRDLKQCRMTPIFFDTFFNLEKYLDHEQRDPFASQRDLTSDNGQEMSDWDRYAAEEYELLVAEEGGNDPSDDMFCEEEMDADDEMPATLGLDNPLPMNMPCKLQSPLYPTARSESPMASSNPDFVMY